MTTTTAIAAGYEPRVSFELGEVLVTVPAVGLHGTGLTLEQAEDDLLGEAVDYAGQWRDFLRTAPNHAPHAAWVQAVLAARTDTWALRTAVFGPPLLDADLSTATAAGLVKVADTDPDLRCGCPVLLTGPTGPVPGTVITRTSDELVVRLQRD